MRMFSPTTTIYNNGGLLLRRGVTKTTGQKRQDKNDRQRRAVLSQVDDRGNRCLFILYQS